MKFEYDTEKSASNKIKHGIDFEEAKLVWEDENFYIVPMRSETEFRFAAVGRVHNKIWTIIFTMRDENIRIISARRARLKETDHYGQG